MIDARAEAIGAHGDAGKLDRISMQLFSRRYIRLSDDEASRVWDVIEKGEEIPAG